MPELSPPSPPVLPALPDALPFALKPFRQAVVLMGIQAAGKTAFYQNCLASTHVHASLDRLGTRRREHALIASCLAQGQSYAVDDTNLTAAVRARFLQPARDAGWEILGLYFRSAIAESIARNARREGKACIPSHAIAASSRKLELPSMGEGFDSLWYLAPAQQGFLALPWRTS